MTYWDNSAELMSKCKKFLRSEGISYEVVGESLLVSLPVAPQGKVFFDFGNSTSAPVQFLVNGGKQYFVECLEGFIIRLRKLQNGFY